MCHVKARGFWCPSLIISCLLATAHGLTLGSLTINGLEAAVNDPAGTFTVSDDWTSTSPAKCQITQVEGHNLQPLYYSFDCDPTSYQYEFTAFESYCDFKVNVSHAILDPDAGVTLLKSVDIPIKCNSNQTIQAPTNITLAPSDWNGDIIDFSSNQTKSTGDTTLPWFEAQLTPSDTFNATLANNTEIDGYFSNFYGCVCNPSHVSYDCCDETVGINVVSDDHNLGSVTVNQTYDEVKSAVPSASATIAPVPEHHVCSGYCYGAARQCSWGSTGDCRCTAPKNEILFWYSAPCVATEQNPNKQHDKRKRSTPAEWRKRETGGSWRSRFVETEVAMEPEKEPGICNASYISYACADAPDGIVHEPLSNWLGAMLPKGSKKYPPIPQEWLLAHDISENSELGEVDLPYWV